MTGLRGPNHAHIVAKAAMKGHSVIGGLMDETGIELEDEFDDDLNGSSNMGMLDDKYEDTPTATATATARTRSRTPRSFMGMRALRPYGCRKYSR